MLKKCNNKHTILDEYHSSRSKTAPHCFFSNQTLSDRSQSKMSQVIVVTGANRGLGAAVIKLLAQSDLNKYRLIAASRANVLPSDLPAGTNVTSMQLDVSDANSIKSFAAKLEKDVGKIDVLVNNAGVCKTSPLTPEDAKLILQTNYHGLLDVTDAVGHLLKEGGRIVNVASVGSKHFMQKASGEPKAILLDPKTRSLDVLNELASRFQVFLCVQQNKDADTDGYLDGSEGEDH